MGLLDPPVKRSEEVYSVRSYGALGNGLADDSPAIQAALNAADANAYKGVVYLPPGRYRLNSSLVPKRGVSIRGAGVGKTVLLPYGSVSAIRDITSGSAGDPLINSVYEDFEIDGINQTLTNGSYSVQTKGIFILFMRRHVFRNLYIHDTAATGLGCDFYDGSTIHSVVAERCGRLNDGTQPGGSGIGIGIGDLSSAIETLTVTECQAIDCKFFGIFIETQDPGKRPFGNVISSNIVRGNKIGIGLCGGTGTIVNGNIAYDNQDGISINPGSFTTPTPDRYAIVSNNVVYGNDNIGIRLSATSGKILEGYQIHGNKVWLNLTGIQATNTDNASKYISISDNHVSQNSQAGISLASASSGTYEHVTISDNMIWNNGTALATPRSAIRIARPVTDLQVIDNRAFDDKVSKTQAEGIYIASGITITGGKIEGNDFSDNASAAVTLLGTLTDVDVRNNRGYNPIGTSSITVSGSPFTYTAGNSPEDIYISGGTVSNISKNSVTLFSATDKVVHLEPRQAITVTYSVAPTMIKDVR